MLQRLNPVTSFIRPPGKGKSMEQETDRCLPRAEAGERGKGMEQEPVPPLGLSE